MKEFKSEITCESDFDVRPASKMFKSCSVCGKKADSDRYFHSHYGAVCCNGCRLFFHRVQLQVSEGFKLKCKTEGNCNTTPSKGKRWCLKCRFSKCLRVGMDPKKKTNHKIERKILMKNRYKRAERTKTNIYTYETSSLSNDDLTIESSGSSQASTLEFYDDSRACSKNSEPLDDELYGRSEIKEEKASFHGVSEERFEDDSPQHGSTSNKQVHDCQTSYFFSYQKHLIETLDSFTASTSLWKIEARHIINYHKGKGVINKRLFISHLANTLENVSQFASNQSQFASLKIEDQRTLLRKNLPLFMQYIIANYFGADSGTEQLNWILMGQISDGLNVANQSIKYRTFKEINHACQLFESPILYEQYKQIIHQIRTHFPMSQINCALIANILLFHTAGCTRLTEPYLVQNMFEEAKKLLDIGQMLEENSPSRIRDNLEYLVHLLHQMDNIFGNSLVCPDNSLESSTIPLDTCMVHAAAEAYWLEQKLGYLQQDYQSVLLPANFLHEYILLSSGKTNGYPSESFMDKWLRLTKTRAKCLLNSSMTFCKLDLPAQTKIWSRNHMAGVALSLVHLNSIHMSGKRQLKNILGYLGKDSNWEAPFATILDLGSLQPVRLSILNCGILDRESLIFFDKLVREMSPLLVEERLFQLFLLLVLLNPEGLELDPNALTYLLKIRQYYLALFQRKLNSVKSPAMKYSSFVETTVKLRVFGKLLELFLIRDY